MGSKGNPPGELGSRRVLGARRPVGASLRGAAAGKTLGPVWYLQGALLRGGMVITHRFDMI